MSYNVPTVTNNNLSFGPARVFHGVAGTTPSTDVGAIDVESVTLSVEGTNEDIRQGNPAQLIYRYQTAQDVKVTFTGLQHELEMWHRQLGTGVTASDNSADSFAWGGDPLNVSAALHIQHYMAQSGHTLDIYVWEAYGDGTLSRQFTQTPHQASYGFTARRSTQDWGGTALATTQSLFKWVRTK